MTQTNAPTASTRTRWVAPADVIDVFVYVVVLNLAAEYVPAVISETFTMSLLTAVLLKVVLEVVVWAKDRVKDRFKAATTVVARLFSGLLLWTLMIGSKFVVLALVGFFFADSVQLGGFWSVTGLILTLLLARFGVRRLLRESDPATV